MQKNTQFLRTYLNKIFLNLKKVLGTFFTAAFSHIFQILSSLSIKKVILKLFRNLLENFIEIGSTNKFFLFLPIVLFALCLVRLDRLFLKRNHGFCLHYIEGKISSNTAWDTPTSFPEDILSQRFHYLGKGSQTYVFESEDKKYVIKFYKFPSHLRKISWLKHPFAYHYEPKRLQIKDHNEKRLALSYNSFFLASSLLPEETSVVYTHLSPTQHLNKKIILIDRLKAEYTLSLDRVGFIVQQKAELLFPTLKSIIEKKDWVKGEKVIGSVIDVIVSRCKKGLTDLDSMIHNNYGWLEDHAIHIDVGRFVPDETAKQPEVYRKEAIRITQLLSDYLAENSPELYAYYQQKISEIAAQ